MSENTLHCHSLNCLPTPLDVEDKTLCLATLDNTPDSFTLISNLLPVRDQGLRGCCVAHAVTCLREGQGVRTYLSPEFIYNHRSNRPQAGMYIRDALQILKTYGCIPEKDYPYDYDTDIVLSGYMMRKAARYRITDFSRISTMEELKCALMTNGPCPIAFPVYQMNGKIWTPRENLLGYHSMTVVGWNPEGFVIRNSWGLAWGSGGYVTYPYDEWGAHCEIWTAYSSETPSRCCLV